MFARHVLPVGPAVGPAAGPAAVSGAQPVPLFVVLPLKTWVIFVAVVF